MSRHQANAHINLRRTTIAASLLAAGCAMLMSFATPAAASIGAGVGAAPVALATPAVPGHTYTLALYVVNTGTVVSSYHVRVQRLSPGHDRTVPASWVAILRNHVTLHPHQGTGIPLRLTVPDRVAGGRYLSDLVASTTSGHRAGATAIGAAAATKLQLQVDMPPGGTPWGTIGLIVLGLVAVGTAGFGARRAGVRLRIERRS